MKQRYFFAYLFFLPLLIAFLSCRKDKEIYADLFYGKWETSYGDTVTFFRESGKNYITYDPELYPAVPADAKNEFIYTQNKLAIKDEYASPSGFRVLQSFTWVQEGKLFTVQGKEWFPSITSPLTYFNFKRIL